MATSSGSYGGIDVSKDRLDVARLGQKQEQQFSKTKGGRSAVRSILYISTLVATRHNPVIQTQYQHLLKRGKLKKVALTACIRKYLTILNAMVRDRQPFRT